MTEPTEHSRPDAPRIPADSYDLRILQALRRIIRAVDLHSHKLSSRYKITGPQLGCLMSIAEDGPLTSAKLSRTIYLSPSTVVGIIDRLEEKGLVERQRSLRDRRQVHISITPAGRTLIAEAPPLLQDKLAEALGNLPDNEQIQMTRALEKLVDLMEAGDIGAAPVLETGSLTSR